MLDGVVVLDVDQPEAGETSLVVPESVRPRRAWYLPLKTTWEWLIALVLIILSAPLVLILAVLVKMTSSGPAIYCQTRLGRNGRTYRMYKLRTMVHDAESACGPVWANKKDPRVTAIGEILRRTHLDELPQLWNVLKGDMSLIGPRPERPELANHIERRIPHFSYRLMVRPGVTGLAQMLLPADDPCDVGLDGLRKKLAHDLYYVREIGFLMDLRIALSTPLYFIAALIDASRMCLLRSFGASIEKDQPHSAEPRSQEETNGRAA